MKKTVLTISAALVVTVSGVGTANAQLGGILRQVEKGVSDAVGADTARNQPEVLPPPTLRMGAAEQKQYKSATDHYGKTVVQGAAIGAVVGAVGCAAAGTDGEVTALCGVIGGGIGAVLGSGIAKKSKELIEDREKINQALVDARANREAASNLLIATETNIAYLEDQIKAYQAKYQAGTISHAQYRSEVKEAKRHLTELESGVDTVEKQMNEQKKLFKNMEKRARKSDDPEVAAAEPEIAEEKGKTENLLETETVRVSNRIEVVEGQLG